MYYIKEVAKVLLYLEERRIVHQDIKPANIMVIQGNQVKLCDLGLAKWKSGGEKVFETVTRQGAILGTPYYISPEILKGEKLDVRSDLYSLGATFYHLIMGAPMFPATNYIAAVNAHLSKEFPSYQEFQNIIPIEVYLILKKIQWILRIWSYPNSKKSYHSYGIPFSSVPFQSNQDYWVSVSLGKRKQISFQKYSFPLGKLVPLPAYTNSYLFYPKLISIA